MSEGDDQLPPPGWYHDPEVEGQSRLWDGSRWTDDRQPIQLSDQSQPVDGAARPAPAPGNPTTIVTPLIFVLFGLLLVGGCGAVIVGLPLVVGGRGSATEPPIPMTATTEVFVVPTTGPPLPTVGGGAVSTTVPGPESLLDFGSPVTMPSDIAATSGPSVWEVTIDQPTDITEAVMAANPLEPQPLEQVRHVNIPLTLTLLDSDPPAVPLEVVADGLFVVFEGGATGAGYTPETVGDVDGVFTCSAVIEGFPTSGQLVVGDSITTSICMQVPAVDVDHDNSRVVVWLGGGPPLAWGP